MWSSNRVKLLGNKKIKFKLSQSSTRIEHHLIKIANRTRSVDPYNIFISILNEPTIIIHPNMDRHYIFSLSRIYSQKKHSTGMSSLILKFYSKILHDSFLLIIQKKLNK